MHGKAGGLGGGTHPDLQQKETYAARLKWRDATDDPPVAVGLSRRRTAVQKFRDSPAPSYGRLGVYLRVLRPWRSTAEKGGFVAYNASRDTELALWGRLRTAVGSRGAANGTVRTLDSFDDRFPAFLEPASAAWDTIPMRSVEYLSWRFRDPRAGR